MFVKVKGFGGVKWIPAEVLRPALAQKAAQDQAKQAAEAAKTREENGEEHQWHS
jgi:hypothetical protein